MDIKTVRLRTLLAISIPLIAFSIFLLNISLFFNFLSVVIDLLVPIFVGFVIASLVRPVYELIAGCLEELGFNRVIKEGVSLAITMSFVALIVLILVLMIFPQLFTSFELLMMKLPDGLANLQSWMIAEVDDQVQVQLLEIINSIMNFISTNSTLILEWINTSLIQMSVYVAKAFWQILVVITSILIFLKDRLYLNRLTKDLLNVFIGKKATKYLSDFAALLSKMSRRYFTAQVLDSIIVGVLFYVFMRLFGLEYALLLSVLNFLTNMIPFFGPFIGAIPSAFILLTVDPMMSFQFLMMTLVIQQVDANVLNPIIHGDSLGIPPIGISFSVLLFGYLFGIFGMIISLPLFGVIYAYAKRWVHQQLLMKSAKEAEQ